jgi:hypothetical protein
VESWKDNKCIENFGMETSWETSTWRLRRRMKDNIKMGVREFSCEKKR